jgi:hypothetical protein
MKRILSERNIVVILFIMVLASFSLAQEDVKKMEKMVSGTKASAIMNPLLVTQPIAKSQETIPTPPPANPAE